MGPELELKEKSTAGVEVSFPNKENIMASQDPQDRLVHCENNFLDQNVVEESLVQGEVEDVELNITECSPFSWYEQVEGGIQDSTETSSSFGDTVTRTDNETVLSDAESPLVENGTMGLASDGFDEPSRTRKRKLTDHWRRFVRPVMWRCKWLELQLIELKSQALKYDKELTEYDHKKQVEFEKIICEGLNAKSKPFSFQVQRNKAMKRKKRKRVEETTDIPAYMTHHNLFSYFGSKKSGPVNTAVENGLDNKAIHEDDDSGFNDGWPSSFEVRDGNDSLEQMLWKIEVAKSQVCSLRTRVQKLVNENPRKLSSIDKLTLLAPCNGLMASENLSSSLQASVHHVHEFNIEDLFMYQSAVSSHGEDEEDILIHNQVAQDELRNYESGINLQKERPQAMNPPEEKPQAEKLAEEKPQAAKLAEEKPQAAKLAEEKPQASELLEEKPEDSELPEEKPQAAELPEEKPQAAKLPEEKPQAISLVEEKPLAIGLPEKPQAIDLAEEKPQALTEKPKTISPAPASRLNFFTNTYKKSRTPSLASGPQSSTTTSKKSGTISSALASGPNSSTITPKKSGTISSALALGLNSSPSTSKTSRKRKTRLPSSSKSKAPSKKRKKGNRK